MNAESFHLLVYGVIRAFGHFTQMSQFLGFDSRAAVHRYVVGQFQDSFQNYREKAISHQGNLLLELRELAAHDQVHDPLALILRNEHPDRYPQLNRRGRDERNIRQEPVEFGKHHECDTRIEGNRQRARIK